MAIVYRTDDGARWGAGKVSNLAPAEVDVNFWEVVQRLVSLKTKSACRHQRGRGSASFI
jgi:hypothetical protein